MWLKIVCGMYPNQTYIFASPTGLWKVVVRVLVGFSYLLSSFDWFVWSKISFKLFVQDFFSWFLTCVYHIDCIIIHWSWNFSSDVIANFQWSVSKPDIWVCFPCGFVEGRGEGYVFCYFTCRNQYIYWIQGSSSSYSSLKFCWWVLYQGSKSLIRLIPWTFCAPY